MFVCNISVGTSSSGRDTNPSQPFQKQQACRVRTAAKTAAPSSYRPQHLRLALLHLTLEVARTMPIYSQILLIRRLPHFCLASILRIRMLQNFVKSRNRKEPCTTRLAARKSWPTASKPSSASLTWRLKLNRSWSTAPGEHILQSAPTSDMAGGRRCINPSMRSDRCENRQCLRMPLADIESVSPTRGL